MMNNNLALSFFSTRIGKIVCVDIVIKILCSEMNLGVRSSVGDNIWLPSEETLGHIKNNLENEVLLIHRNVFGMV